MVTRLLTGIVPNNGDQKEEVQKDVVWEFHETMSQLKQVPLQDLREERQRGEK